jgi:hypothetical protein
MHLKIKRSQKTGGILGNKVVFMLDIRAEYTLEEKDNINKYKLGTECVYSSENAKKHAARADAHLDGGGSVLKGIASAVLANMSLNVTIASLQQGHHIETKSLEELLEAEETLKTACRNLTSWLDAASTFDGRETIIEYRNGTALVAA